MQTRYIWAVICGVLAFVLAKALLHYGFWLALLIGLVVAVIVLLLALVFAPQAAEGFAGASPVAPPKPAAPVPAPAPAAAPAPAPLADIPAAPEPAPVAAAPTPSISVAPTARQADDLKEIEGIGPALEKLLNEMGVTRYAQIAAWTDPEIAAVDAQMGRFRGRIVRDRWIAQAKLIQAEGLDAFRLRAKTNDY